MKGHRVGSLLAWPAKDLRRVAAMAWIAGVASAVVAASGCRAGTIDPERPTMLVTGSNRGIGLAFADHYARAGWNVIATARSPAGAARLQELAADYPHVVVEQLDVTDGARIAELANAYRNVSIDLLINNAGIYGDVDEQTWGNLDPETFRRVMAVNAFAPLKMAEAFADHVARSGQKKIVAITSGVSSLTLGLGARNGLIYAISKAALNMAMRKAGAELSSRGVIVALVTPGLVDTDMLALSRPGYENAISPEESVAGMAAVIAGLDETYDGAPVTYEGESLPW
jgi:NAD(P)-dependent dehydrogenase (short-subunit alcohol dehydrogenase family)